MRTSVKLNAGKACNLVKFSLIDCVILLKLGSTKCVKRKFASCKSKIAFATELFDLIELSNVDYWIFGHSHEVVPDFKIGKTTLTTNQLGYVEYGEHHNFLQRKILDF